MELSDPRGVRFVQEATVSYCCPDWGADDQVVIFTTNDAHTKNWLDDSPREAMLTTQEEGKPYRARVTVELMSESYRKIVRGKPGG